MRGKWLHVAGLLLVLLLASCRTNRPNVKPPDQPEMYNLPPMSDNRFVQPVSYPEETLHENPMLRKKMLSPAAGGPGIGGMRSGLSGNGF